MLIRMYSSKIIVLSIFAVVALFGALAFNVSAQTMTPSPSPTATTVPEGAPSTGYGALVR